MTPTISLFSFDETRHKAFVGNRAYFVLLAPRFGNNYRLRHSFIFSFFLIQFVISHLYLGLPMKKDLTKKNLSKMDKLRSPASNHPADNDSDFLDMSEGGLVLSFKAIIDNAVRRLPMRDRIEIFGSRRLPSIKPN